MNKRYIQRQKSLKNSPVLIEEEEINKSPDDPNIIKSSVVTPQSKLHTDHSTPIQSRYKIDYDSHDLNYNESPIEPLTQHPPNEVGWDYQRLGVKDEDIRTPVSMEINKTPKRSVFFSKKRNSNSPLLYKPLKKKLIQEEQQESIAGFMAELKAIEIKAKKIGEKNVEALSKIENEGEENEIEKDEESELIVEMDSQPINYLDLKLQVSALTESPIKCTINRKKNYDALLDDSIEDIMVLCSQEVEAKEFGINKIHHKTSTNSSQEKFSLKVSPDLSLNKVVKSLSKENLHPTYNNKNIDNKFNQNSHETKKESDSLEIPDDSFDEFFVGIDDNVIDKNENTEICINNINKSVLNKKKSNAISSSTSAPSAIPKPTAGHNKFFQYKNYTSKSSTSQSKFASTNMCTHVNSQASNASVQNKVINTKANFGYLNKNYVRSSNTSFESQIERSDGIIVKNSDTRLFKAKSYSDSNFLHNSSSISIDNGYKNNSNCNVYSMNQEKEQSNNSVNQNIKSSYYSSGSTMENKSWRRVQSSPSIDKSSIRQSNINKLSNGEKMQSLSTAAEIERKRQEAIMKREARLKMKFDHMSLKRPIQHPIKR